MFKAGNSHGEMKVESSIYADPQVVRNLYKLLERTIIKGFRGLYLFDCSN